MSPNLRLVPFVRLVVIALVLAGCGDSTKPVESPYLPNTSPANVLANLKTAYVLRDTEGYAGLLADDFHFYFDEDTRNQEGLPQYWVIRGGDHNLGRHQGQILKPVAGGLNPLDTTPNLLQNARLQFSGRAISSVG